MPALSWPSPCISFASVNSSIGRLMTIPRAPVLSCFTIRITAWRKRGSPICCVATNSWPASDAGFGVSSGVASAAALSSIPPHDSMTRLDSMSVIASASCRDARTGANRSMLSRSAGGNTAMSETPTFGRYAEIPFDRMTPEQQEGYRFLVDGPRGRLPGPYKVWVHNPKLVHAAAPLGQHFTPGASSLSEREREIAVVVITSKWHSAYPNNAHERRGKEVGLR